MFGYHMLISTRSCCIILVAVGMPTPVRFLFEQTKMRIQHQKEKKTEHITVEGGLGYSRGSSY
jgi:hypothetical protein